MLRNEIFRSFLDLVPIPVVLTNLKEGTIVAANDAGCAIIGQDRNALVGRTASELGFVSQESRTAYVDNLMRGDEVSGIAIRIPNKSGQLLYGQMFATRITREGEEYILAFFVQTSKNSVDPGDREQCLEDIRKLVSRTIHDVNNLLFAARGYAELMKSATQSAEDMQEGIHAIIETIQLASEINKQLVDITRSRVRPWRRVDMHQLIVHVAEAVTPLFSPKVQFRRDLRSSVPWVIGNATQIRRALVNLIINACEAMNERSAIEIVTRTVRFSDDDQEFGLRVSAGEYMLIAISDSGGGISEENIARVFEPFFSCRKSDGGTGLGLSIVAEIVREHGGDIRVLSELGTGTRFEFVLPLFCGDEEIVPAAG